MKLPEAFTERMDRFFLDHPELNGEDFYASFDATPRRGLRFNRLKVQCADKKRLLASLGQIEDSVPWCPDGYYVSDFSSGKDAYYHAGVYYIQEPSAMLPAEILGVLPGEKVLDLCAAPGGKATRIGADLQGRGLLVANEISEERSRALLRNIELFGIENAVITNETPLRLEKRFASYFDRILIDAPCSGEGMFRRDKNAVKSWERYGPSSCEIMQREILMSAHHMLKPGGHIVYSTCTFGTSENEDMMDWFLLEFPEYEVIGHPDVPGVTVSSGKSFTGAMRIWPQISRGDGHFCIHLQKSKEAHVGEMKSIVQQGKKTDASKLFTVRSAREALLAFAKEIMQPAFYAEYAKKMEHQFYLQGDKAHILPISPVFFDAVKVVKMGAFPGEIKMTPKGRVFIPSHAMALALSREALLQTHVFSIARNDERLQRYLHGETIMISEDERELLEDQAYVLILAGHFPVGWGKSNGNTMKNLYPKAWRLQ